jgi:hypothetical protein
VEIEICHRSSGFGVAASRTADGAPADQDDGAGLGTAEFGAAAAAVGTDAEASKIGAGERDTASIEEDIFQKIKIKSRKRSDEF